jgi:hypothetical protein
MSPRRLWWTMPVLIFMVILFPGLARADDITGPERAYAQKYGAGAICPTIAEYPTEAGVFGVVEGIHLDGWDYPSAVNIVNVSVATWCPAYWPLLERIGRRARHEQAV